MTVEALIALVPLIVVAGTTVIVMLAIACYRDFRLSFYLTLAGLLLAAFTLPLGLRVAPIQVTSLVLIDAYALFFSGLTILGAVIVTLLSGAYFRRSDDQNEELFVLLLSATLGGMVLVCSDHFAMFFLGLEILSVSLFPMVAYRVRCKLPLEAGIKYLMLSGVSSALLLFGMALIYGESGTLSFPQLGQAAESLAQNPLAQVGTILILAALGFKLSLAPFHLWTPDVYQGAPAPVTAFVATVSKGAVFALFLRFWVSSHAAQSDTFSDLLTLIAMVSILGGNLLALLQANLKRMLAYSSIAHMGYLLTAVIAGSSLQTDLLTESVAFYVVAYMITNLGAFGVVSALSNDERESEELNHYQGLFWHDPVFASILTANLLSLAGIPLTIGFIGKFYVFAASVSAKLWPLVAVVVIGSGIGLYYYLRVVLVMCAERDTESRSRPASPLVLRLMLSALVLVLLWSGIAPQPLVETIIAITKSLS